jgi:hypothetical protein
MGTKEHYKAEVERLKREAEEGSSLSDPYAVLESLKGSLAEYVKNDVDETGTYGYVEPGGGMKFDEDKLRMELIDPYFIEEVAEVLSYGAEKYDENSWQLLEDAERRYKGALLRHLYAYLRGELDDDESGLKHLQHAATNIMFLLYFARQG